MNTQPIAMIRAPETFSAAGPVSAVRSARWPSRPSVMKMNEKLPTNARLGRITRRARTSPGATPATAEMYPGTSGSTHGERNEISPAPNATGIPMPDAASISVPRVQADRLLLLRPRQLGRRVCGEQAALDGRSRSIGMLPAAQDRSRSIGMLPAGAACEW
jgi:hypothetical protein